MKLPHIAAAMILLALGASPVLAQTRVVELGHEAVPSMITLPRSATGELVLQICATCKTLRLRANENTHYFVGREEVSIAEMTKYLVRNPMIPLVVVQPREQLVLSRVVASATSSAK